MRYELNFDEDKIIDIEAIGDNGILGLKDCCKIMNKQEAIIEEYKDFCLNLCKFLIQKRLVDEYREKYGKEYKIITKWW